MIDVKYDGVYPNACCGTLRILVDHKPIYEKKYCCKSTGCIYYNEQYEPMIEHGHLIWLDSCIYSLDIQQAVKEKLKQIDVCCGGCT